MNFSSDFLFKSERPSLFTGIVFQFQYTSPLVVARGKFASTNQKHFPDLGSDASSEYGISRLVSQTSFRGETSGGVAKSRLFSPARRSSVLNIL